METATSIIGLIILAITVYIAFSLTRHRQPETAAFDLKAHNDEVERLLGDPAFAEQLKRSVELEAAVIAAIVTEIGNLGGDAVYEKDGGYQSGGFWSNFWASITETDRQTVKGKLIEKVLGLVNEFAKAALGVPTRK